MLEVLELPFFQRVLAAGLLASVASGVIGSYVVARRITSLAGGLSHASFGGVGLGYLLGFPPMLGATGFAVAAGLGIGLAHLHLRSGLDTLVSMIWSVGMALGVLFVALAPGYAPDLTSYLFGSLLFVPWSWVGWVAALDLLIVATVLLLHRSLQAVAFDEEFAAVAGLPVRRLFLALLGLAALAVVTLIRVVGVILAIALLTLPAATARHWADSLPRMMGLATALSAGCVTAGLLLSYTLSARLGLAAPPGPLVILLACCVWGVSAGLARARHRA